MEGKKLMNLAVLCGGFSNEREISLASADNVMKYLDADKYLASRIDIVSEDEWYWSGQDGATRTIDLKREEDIDYLKTFDVFFNALHGAYGEDGALQRVLEGIGVPYTGSGVVASELAIDKIETMKLVSEKKMLIPKFFSVTDESPEGVIQKIKESFGYPAIVKPNAGGSTIGLTLVQKPEDVAAALDKAAHVSPEVIVQRYIFGREFTCGILGNSSDPDLILLPPVEIIIKNQIFDYNDKYFSKETQELCPAPIDKFAMQRIQGQALLAHRTLGCDGMSRSDFRMDGAGQLYFLETNTSPGLTTGSLCPKEAAVAGISMPQLLDRIIDLGLRRVAPVVP